MPKKRPVNATTDELQEVKDELQAAIDGLQAEAATKAESRADRAQLEARLEALTEQVNQHAAQAAEARERLSADAQEQADAMFQRMQAEAQRLVQEQGAARISAEAALEESLREVDSSLRNTVADELEALCRHLDARLADLNQGVVEQIEYRAAQAADALASQRKQLDAILERGMDAAARDRAEIRSEMAAEARCIRQELAETHDRLAMQAEQARTALQQQLDTLRGTVSENRSLSNSSVFDLRTETFASLADFRATTESHLSELDQDAADLRDGISEVRNGPTRRVEWVIGGASKALAVPLAGYAEYFSPTFHASGARFLQLELRCFSAEATSECTGAGDCALYLWAGEGLHICSRLFIGNKSATIERVYSKRMAHGTKRMCFFKDQICEADGTLRVGVELLEVVREIEVPTLQVLGGAQTKLAWEGAQADDSREASPFEGSLVCHRLLNNRILPQVRKEVERMQSRMVRRIEWQLEYASSLPQLFPKRQHICSPVFSAAGVDGMQLIFYPSGYGGAQDHFCSLFLYCPAGVQIRCCLCGGKQKRESHYTYEEAGAYGRTNFCRYDSLFDETTNTLTLALEVEECRQELSTRVGDPPAIGGDVKLTRIPGQMALTDVKLIPSLWTAKALGDTNKPADGYRTFGALKSAVKANGGRPPTPTAIEPEEGNGDGTAAANQAISGDAIARRSASTPVLTPLANSPSPADVQSDVLPLLCKTASSEWGDVGWSGTRKPRGSRRPAALAAPPLLAAAPC